MAATNASKTLQHLLPRSVGGLPSRWISSSSTSGSVGKEDGTKTILELLKSDLKDAMRSKDSSRAAMLRSVLSDHQYSEKQVGGGGGKPSTITQIIQKQIQKRKEASEQYLNAKRSDLSEKEEAEIESLKKFLPRQLEDQEILTKVEEAFESFKVSGGEGKSTTNPKKLEGILIRSLSELVESGSTTNQHVSRNVKSFLQGREI
ncbi:GatB/YqeY domain-containing protein [Violaceomyces palustris]|uniref:GatB/YqeY domain-containing protein n=1 Tax=Violaceomyces palustris TaxID=1673888 RepID=A0ACD0P550_9BASI|nr:GatB/YqeY domain-containing protein [Violaceomyces palustris]